MGTDWQSIETAPRDGRYIIVGRFSRENSGLVWVKHSRWLTVEEIADVEGGEPDDYQPAWADGNDDSEPCYPTHWMPLPAPQIASVSA